MQVESREKLRESKMFPKILARKKATTIKKNPTWVIDMKYRIALALKECPFLYPLPACLFMTAWIPNGFMQPLERAHPCWMPTRQGRWGRQMGVLCALRCG